MKIKFYSFFAFILSLIPSLCLAQAPDWTRVLQTNTFGAHTFNAVSANANNIFAGMAITSNITFDETNFTPIGTKDLLLVKLNHDGNTVWKKQLNANTNGTIYAISIKPDASGNIYVSGILFGSITIGSSTISTTESLNAVFLAKFDSDGNGLWATTLFYSSGGSSIRIETDANGNAYLLCNSSKLIKISSAGTKVFEQTYPVRTLQAIAIYGTNLYIGGCLQGPASTTFGTLTLTPSAAYNTGFIVKGDLDGNYTNSVLVDGSPIADGSSVSDIIFDGSGNLIITGGFVKNLVLGLVSITKTSQSNYTYIAKCDNSFNFLWAKSSTDLKNYIKNWNYRLFLDNSNNIYQYGFNDYSFKYDAIEHVSLGSGGQFLFKFDSNGIPTNGYALNNTTLEKFTITNGGKIVYGGSYIQDHPNGYGNFYLTQLNNDLTESWAKVSSNCLSGTVSIKYIKHDAVGNTYICARILGRCNYFGTDFNTTTSLTIISKHDINGDQLWLNQISDISPNLYGTSFALDEDNNVLIVGLFKTSLTVGTATLTSSNSNYEGYVAKYNSSGVFQWASKMNLGDNVSYNINLAIDNDSNVLVSGVKSPENYIVKFNSSGEQLWAKSFAMESDFLSQVSTDLNNNIYLTSEIYLKYSANGSTTTIGTVTLNQSEEDGGTTLIKFDHNGNAIWANTYGKVPGATRNYGFPCVSKTDALGNTYIWGWCENNSVFGSTTLTNPFPSFERYSYYLAKINTSGDVVWAKAIYENKYSFNYGDLLDLDKDGNIYLGGHFRDKISIEGNEYTPEGTNDFFITKYSNNGTFQWIKTIPSDGGSIINALSVYDNDVLSIVGLAGKNSNLGNTTINRKNGSNCIVATLGYLRNLSISATSLTIAAPANSNKSFDITSNTNWTVTCDQSWLTPSIESGSNNSTITLTASANPNITTRTAIVTVTGSNAQTKTITVTQDSGTTGIFDVEDSKTINIFPNPSNGEFTLGLNNYGNENISVTVSNVIGNTIKEITLKGLSEVHTEKLNLGHIESGIYFIIIRTNSSKIVKTITITHH